MKCGAVSNSQSVGQTYRAPDGFVPIARLDWRLRVERLAFNKRQEAEYALG